MVIACIPHYVISYMDVMYYLQFIERLLRS